MTSLSQKLTYNLIPILMANTHVIHQWTFLIEASSTSGTGVWFLAGVNTNMLSEVVLSSKLLITEGTVVLLISVVLILFTLLWV